MEQKDCVKKKSFPKKISIMGRTWKIKQVSRPTYKDELCLGMCDYDGKVIYLEKDQDDDSKFSTLVHEAAHAWLILCGLDQKMSESEVEVNCQLMAAFVEDVVRSFK